MDTIQSDRGIRNTRQQNPTAIIKGPHRWQGADWMDAMTLAFQGWWLVREGSDVRAIAADIGWGTA